MTDAEFLTAYNRVRRLLGHIAKRMARSPVFGQQDLMQVAAATLWRDRAKAAAAANPAGWMAQAGKWAMRNHVRKHRRRHRLHGHTHLDAIGERDHPAACDPAPDESAALLVSLDPATAELVRRKVIAGEAAHALAAEGGVRPRQIRRRVAEALDRIREHLAG